MVHHKRSRRFHTTKGIKQTLLAKRNGAIKTRYGYSGKRNTCRRVLTVSNESVKSKCCDKINQRAKLNQNDKMMLNANSIKMDNFNRTDRELKSSRNSKVHVRANYEKERTLQPIVGLVKERNAGQISRLPPRWREKFISLSLDNNGLYMDERLVIPIDMRNNMLSAIHFGHAGRDTKLREAADFGDCASIAELSKKPKVASNVDNQLKVLNGYNLITSLRNRRNRNYLMKKSR